jgi:hypothetical protein
VDLAVEAKRPDQSLGDLFSDMTTELSDLFRNEVELVKVETRDELKRAGKVGGMFGGAALAGWMTVLFLSLALAWLLDQELNTALSFAIVAAIWGIAMAVLAVMGRNHARKLEGLPVTRETLKEDMAWAKQQKT